MINVTKQLSLMCTLLLCSPLPVGATVLTFNGTAADGGATGTSNTLYTEAGFNLLMGIPVNFLDDTFANLPGLLAFDDDVLEFNSNAASFVMTEAGGGLFDLLSVLTGTPGRDASDNSNFVFTGTFGIGGTITTTVSSVFSTLTPVLTNFSGFTGLLSLSVTTTDGIFPVMDNLTVALTTSVPEPTTMTLLALGLLSVCVTRKRRTH